MTGCTLRGRRNGYAIDTLGLVHSWGQANFGALGHDASDSCSPSGSCSLYPAILLTSDDPNTGTFFGPVKSIDGGSGEALALALM